MKTLEENLISAIKSCQENLQKISLGRSQSDIFDLMKIDYYGNKTPLTHVSIVTVIDHSKVTIQPYEKSMLKDVERLIRTSNLNLNPIIDGDVVRVNFPPLTLDKRDHMIKLAKEYGEASKIVIREHRRTGMKDLEVQELSKNEVASQKKNLEKQVSDAVQKVDDLVKSKVSQLNKLQ